jgi:hypothetical protein
LVVLSILIGVSVYFGGNSIMKEAFIPSLKLKKTNAKIARRVYRDGFTNGNPVMMLVYPFSSWEEFNDNVRGLPKIFQRSYEKNHGKGSWRTEVVNVLSKHTNGTIHEVMTMVR